MESNGVAVVDLEEESPVLKMNCSLGRTTSNYASMRRVDSLMLEAGKLKSMGSRYMQGNSGLSWRLTLCLAYQTIGVIYGDLGTSPLYVFDTTFSDAYYNASPSKNDVLGALSIILYTFTLIPLVKYVFLVLYANDRGQGGTFALFSLICRHARIRVATNEVPEDHDVSTYKLTLSEKNFKRAECIKTVLKNSKFLQRVLLIIALLGTCAVIGDGVLTPSISVLSAIQGLKVNTPSLSQDVVVGVSCAILVILFAIQRFGTDKVGYTFAPCLLVWFISIALIGVYNIVKHEPGVLKALNPYYIYGFFNRNRKQAWVSLGGIVLCITGTEAMFADLGHFSVRSIQIAFTTIVYPCLLAAYIGQAAYLMKFPEEIGQTFYKSIPDPLYWPMFVVATVAAIIASQAMISATFSVVDQSMALSCFPRVKVIHTSKKYFGQIYIPEMNWLLMILCLIVLVGFRDATQIGHAYGVAVVAVMVVTTNLLALIMLMVWQSNLLLVISFWTVFSSLELLYFSSVMFKVPQGGWVPLVFAAVFSIPMYTWHYGKKRKYDFEMQNKVSIDYVTGLGASLGMVRVPGIGLVYSELALGVPTIFSHLISNLPSIHSVVVFVCIKYLPVPTVPDEERFLVRRLGPNAYRMYRCAVRYGYIDRQGEDGDFEKLLIDNLMRFILIEAGELSNNSRALSANGEGTHCIQAEIPNSAENPHPAQDAAAIEEELNFLERSNSAGIVYFVGQTETRAKPGSNWFRRFIIDNLFDFLRRNSRSPAISLGIPTKRLLQVGMVYEI